MEKYQLFIVLGILLIIIDSFILSFFLIPIGVGFITGGIFYYFYPEIFGFFIGFLIGVIPATYFSIKYSKKLKNKVSDIRELIGKEGYVVRQIDEFTYLVRFPMGVGGEELWNGYSEEKLNFGDKVKVIKIEGNKIIVKKEKTD
ncbi:hypothetical protein JCM14244_08690 [Venenivibrio stagnispumantis]|uniref:Membrane protein implicated in regulation of membrane protease activity n=1 Tax=Venenivibrio stagnispumantis TaxID=407998 RepID=A0AA46AEC6_9AQUI|nr:NfeD family protein [Venenivibrio stagnispumantis]MCW4573431.1 NfeD family protein [Venenivibrio stagnispumantis]SMP11996.1 Membrane protein implicated in regulation of membrane protease activity [Venenivibrio stagnispumantis]